MQELKTWLNQFGTLPEPSWNDLEAATEEVLLKKGQQFQQVNKPADKLGFLKAGALVTRHSGPSERHSVAYFSLPSLNPIVGDLLALTNCSRASLSIEAESDSTLFIVRRKRLHALYAKHQPLERLGRILAEHSYSSALGRISRMRLAKKERISELYERSPEVFKAFKNKDIALYLGMTPAEFSKCKAAWLKNGQNL